MTECFHQYANKLAHLWDLNKVDAGLVFVYFAGATTVGGEDPVSHKGWQTAMNFAIHHLGIRANSPWIRKILVGHSGFPSMPSLTLLPNLTD